MSEEIQNRIVGIIGRKGTGKSTTLAERLQGEDRVFVWDPMAEHGDWLPNELGSIEETRKFLRWSQKRKLWAASYVPGSELEHELEEISDLYYSVAPPGPRTFAVEEVPLICSPNYLPEKFGKLLRTGRHRQIDLYWTAQRAGEVSRTLTSLTDEFVLFSQTEPRDLDAIAARCGSPVADRVAHLGRHDYIVWDVADRRLTNQPEAGEWELEVSTAKPQGEKIIEIA